MVNVTLGFVIFGFIFAGTFTTLLNKWTNGREVAGHNGIVHKFNHAFVQTFFMFVGEFLCLLIYYAIYCYLKFKGEGHEETNKFTKGTRKFNVLFMLPSCIFDLLGTTCCFIGLNFTFASSFQMFRGSVILFTGLFSFMFLGKRLNTSEITGMILVVGGLVIVGFCDFYLVNPKEAENISPWMVIIGDFIIILGQVFLALMMVYQQKVYCTRFDVPVLQAVGLEGFFGLILIILLQVIFYYCYVGSNFGKNPRQVIEDAVDACLQMKNDIWIFWALFASALLTTLYNYCGLTITKEISALSRKILDSVRTITIWFLAVLVFGQPFIWQTVFGFLLLIFGIFLYNKISFFGDAKKKTAEDEE